VIGYIIRIDAESFDGILPMVGNERLKGFTNGAEIPSSMDPDFPIFGERLVEVGAGWHRTGVTSWVKIYLPDL